MDIVSAQRELKEHCDQIDILLSLSRSMMTAKEMVNVDEKLKRHRERARNIRINLYEAQPQKTYGFEKKPMKPLSRDIGLL